MENVVSSSFFFLTRPVIGTKSQDISSSAALILTIFVFIRLLWVT